MGCRMLGELESTFGAKRTQRLLAVPWRTIATWRQTGRMSIPSRQLVFLVWRLTLPSDRQGGHRATPGAGSQEEGPGNHPGKPPV